LREPLPANRWAALDALFEGAIAMPASGREAFLREACGDDWELREEVLQLLRYDTPDDTEEFSLLEALQAGAASVIGDESAAGRMLGPYRIERAIGRGGMAVVYLGSRADGLYQKQVAIKLIKRGMDTAAVVGRLRRERSILAALDHPYIARLLDGGATPDGLPYIVMDFVEGVTIDRYCEEHRLSVEERCELIGKVCDAVAYAHRNLVVHRDLKPGNIMVGPDGNPKLLDFGIAKLLSGDPDVDAGPETRGVARPLTPEYASPEQRNGSGNIGTTSDVYSLGVILYELLAGERPRLDADKASVAALRMGRGKRWSRRLAGDLDNILKMALRPEPERRYLSIGQLQADLKLHLTGMPVSAREETLRYRLGKFLARHRLGAVAALLIVLSLAGGMTATLWQARRAEAEKRIAEQRLGQLVELANRTLFNVHDAIERLPGATPARLEIVRTTLEYLDRLNAESGNDIRVLSALASAYARVARVQGSPLQPNLGDLGGAEQSYIKAGKIFDTLMARGADDADLRQRDAGLRGEYGELLFETGRPDNAIAQYRRGLEQVGILLQRDPHNLAARKANSSLHLEIGQVTKTRDPAATRREDLALLPLDEALAREYPRDADCLLSLASLYSQIGSTFEVEGNPVGAMDGFRRSVSLREQLFALRPQDVTVQHDLLIAYGHLGDLTGTPLFQTLGDYRGGVSWYKKAAAIAHQMAAADPSNIQARNDEGTALMRIGASQTAAGENREALESLERAEILLEPLRTASPASVPLAGRLAIVYEYRGRALLAVGENAAAIGSLRRSMDICRGVLNAHPAEMSCLRQVWLNQDALAPALAAAGDGAGARKEAQDVLESVSSSGNLRVPSDRAHLARALAANGAVYAILKDRKQAAEFYRRAVAEWHGIPKLTEPYVGEMRATERALKDGTRDFRRVPADRKKRV
jgi:tetratricopeptide (TPR) repeat protein